jgi:hypothetical protein
LDVFCLYYSILVFSACRGCGFLSKIIPFFFHRCNKEREPEPIYLSDCFSLCVCVRVFFFAGESFVFAGKRRKICDLMRSGLCGCTSIFLLFR